MVGAVGIANDSLARDKEHFAIGLEQGHIGRARQPDHEPDSGIHAQGIHSRNKKSPDFAVVAV